MVTAIASILIAQQNQLLVSTRNSVEDFVLVVRAFEKLSDFEPQTGSEQSVDLVYDRQYDTAVPALDRLYGSPYGPGSLNSFHEWCISMGLRPFKLRYTASKSNLDVTFNTGESAAFNLDSRRLKLDGKEILLDDKALTEIDKRHLGADGKQPEKLKLVMKLLNRDFALITREFTAMVKQGACTASPTPFLESFYPLTKYSDFGADDRVAMPKSLLYYQFGIVNDRAVKVAMSSITHRKVAAYIDGRAVLIL